MALLQFLLKHRSRWHVEFAVHHQHAVALCLGSLYVAVLLFLVGGIQIDEITVFVGLVVLYECAVFVEGEVLALCVLHHGEVLGAVVERRVAEHAIVDEYLQVVPFLLVGLAVFLEDAVQAVAHLLGDIC